MGKILYFLKKLDNKYKLPLFLFGMFNLPILIMIFLSKITSFKIFLKVFLDIMIIFVCFRDIKKIYMKSKKFEGGVER